MNDRLLMRVAGCVMCLSVAMLAGCQTTYQLQPVDERPVLPKNRLRPDRAPEPDMTSEASANCQTGWVHVAFKISREGLVTNPMVVRSSPAGVFDAYAVNSLREWAFKSARFQRIRAYHTIIDFPLIEDCQ